MKLKNNLQNAREVPVSSLREWIISDENAKCPFIYACQWLFRFKDDMMSSKAHLEFNHHNH